MGCCGSTANAPSSPLPVAAESASVPVELVRVLTATPPVSEPSSANLSRTRSRAQSLHQASRHSTKRSGSTHRTRTQSAPQNAQPMRSFSSQDRRIRAQTSVTPGMGSHSIPGPSNPGECDSWLAWNFNDPPHKRSRRRGSSHSLQRCEKFSQIIPSKWPHSGTLTSLISHLRRFRILVVGKVRSCNTQRNSGQVVTALRHREAREKPRSLMLSSK